MAPQPHSPSFPSDSYASAKARLRARCRQRRDDLGGTYRDQASQHICERIRRWAAFPPSGIVFTYLPMRGEVDLRPLITDASRIRWAIPRVLDAPFPHLVFHEYHPDHLVPHGYGMLEPDPSLPAVQPGQADLILVPGLAFTPQGFRLGYGGGYYDRLLSAPGHAPTLGACFQALLLDAIPHEDHDMPVDYVVTEDFGVVPTLDG